MKAWIFSDVHTDVVGWLDGSSLPDADVCICAGNVQTGNVRRSIQWLGDRVSDRMPVIFVLGNREYYGTTVSKALQDATAAADHYPALHVLDGRDVEIGGVRFIGTTLWSDFRLFGDQLNSMKIAGTRIDDYRRIKFSSKPVSRLSPRKAVALYNQAEESIRRCAGQEHAGPTVVVSHHGLSRSSDILDDLSPSRASVLDSLIEDVRPLLWVHGHLNCASNYLVGDTRVICNPRCHKSSSIETDFDPDLLAEIAA